MGVASPLWIRMINPSVERALSISKAVAPVSPHHRLLATSNTPGSPSLAEESRPAAVTSPGQARK
jgi:hypothetical protein